MWTTAGMAFWATSAMAVVKSMEGTFWAFAPVGKSQKSPPRISKTAVKVLLQIFINLIPPFSFYGYWLIPPFPLALNEPEPGLLTGGQEQAETRRKIKSFLYL
jgi:hypothetical protein